MMAKKKKTLLNAKLYSHPLVFAVGNEAFGLWARGLTRAIQCADGLLLHDSVVDVLAGKGGSTIVNKLVEAGMWQPTKGGYLYVDFGCAGKQAFKFDRREWSTDAYPFVYARDGKRCRYCGTVEGPFAVDHVNPRVQGGGDGSNNLVVACKSCNLKKSGRTPAQARMNLLPVPEVRHGW